MRDGNPLFQLVLFLSLRMGRSHFHICIFVFCFVRMICGHCLSCKYFFQANQLLVCMVFAFVQTWSDGFVQDGVICAVARTFAQSADFLHVALIPFLAADLAVPCLAFAIGGVGLLR